MNIIIPRDILNQIDNNRGCVSQQSYIIKILTEYFGSKNTVNTEEEPNKQWKTNKTTYK